jgi:hypothetical protein
MRREPKEPTVPATTSQSPTSSLTSSATKPLSSPRMTAGGLDREHLLDRLNHLRAILPAFAEELASSHRQTAALRNENCGLLAEVRRLQRRGAMGVLPPTQTDQRSRR